MEKQPTSILTELLNSQSEGNIYGMMESWEARRILMYDKQKMVNIHSTHKEKGNLPMIFISSKLGWS